MLNVHLLPSLTSEEQLRGKTVVVIDVLRATTTICYALAAGAKVVIPAMEVEEAREIAQSTEGEVLLGGERDAVRIPGFDLGNSPAEYSSSRVGGRTIVFTTSNGTKAMRQCRRASRVLLASFSNLSAICDRIGVGKQVEILCSGTDNEITREDALLAGAIVDQLRSSGGSAWQQLNDQAELVFEAWSDVTRELTQRNYLTSAISRSQGARNLMEAGLESDIDLCAQIDRLEVVPELHLADWQIRLA